MKCQKCGRNEVNFHYTSNINGAVTEMHLCSDCAAESGHDIGRMLEPMGMLGGLFPIFGRQGGFFGMPAMRIREAYPFMMAYRPMIPEQASACEPGGACGYEPVGAATCEPGGAACGCEKPAPDVEATVVDGEMAKRRQINEIREQMNAAAKNEDFEAAARLRDKIKQMEA